MLNEIHRSVMALNTNAYFSGLIMIILNIGSKYITIQLSKTQEQYLKTSIGRQILIFSIIWMGIRDIYKSLILTAVFIVLTDYLFNENSNLCILPMKFRQLESAIDTDSDNEITEYEMNNALKILQEAKKQFEHRNKLTAVNNFIK